MHNADYAVRFTKELVQQSNFKLSMLIVTCKSSDSTFAWIYFVFTFSLEYLCCSYFSGIQMYLFHVRHIKSEI